MQRDRKLERVTGVPATGLRLWLALRFSAWVQKKATQQASGDLCVACGHDAFHHQAQRLRDQRRRGVPRGACARCQHRAEIGLRTPTQTPCAGFTDRPPLVA